MATPMTIKSIISDNKIYAQFSRKTLPKYARQGELYVVDGILYIYSSLEGNGIGRWFPLTENKDIFKYDQETLSSEWTFPVKWVPDNHIQYIIYGSDDKVYTANYTISNVGNIITISFDIPVKGTVYVISKLIDNNINIGDGNFAISTDPINTNIHYLSIDTEFVKILKDGDVDFQKDLNVYGQTTLSDVHITKNMQVDGNLNINGNLSISGTKVDINTSTLNVSDNVITINKGTIGVPTKNAGIEVDRGSNGILSILTFDEQSSKMMIPVKYNDSFIQDEISTKSYVDNVINNEYLRATNIEGELQLQLTNINNIMSTDVERLEAIQNVITQFNIADNNLNGVITTLGATLETKITSTENELNNVKDNIINLLDFEILRSKSVEGDLINLITTDKSSLVASINETNIDIQTEVNERVNSYNLLSTNINALINDNTDNLINSLNLEISRATTSEILLQNNIDTEKGRIDAILLASTADKDSFKEIVDLINSVDTTNDTAFAGYVTSNNLRSTNIETSLINEINDRTLLTTSLEQNINIEKNRIDAWGSLTDFNTAFESNK